MFCGTSKSELSVERAAIWRQVDRIAGSSQFCASDRMRRFLRFIIAEALADRSHQLKEYTIGMEVFDRSKQFEPLIDPIVRVEARRLRDKLTRYYQAAGRQDEILIEVPKGAYVPRFGRVHRAAQIADNLPTLTVLPFAPVTGAAEPISGGFLHELIDQFVRVHQIHIRTGKTGPLQFIGPVLSGCIHTPDDRIRVVAHVTETASDACRWSTAVDEPLSSTAHESVAATLARSVTEYLVVEHAC